MPFANPALAQQVPHDKEGDEQVHLTKSDSDEHRIEKEGRQAQYECETPGRHLVEGRSDLTQGQQQHADERGHVAHRPDRLHQSDAAEGPLPRREQEGRKRGIGEREARVGEHKGIEVGREDVPPAQSQVHTEVDFVRPQRDVQAVGDRERDRHQGGTPATEPAERGLGEPVSTAAAVQRLIDGCHGTSRNCRVISPQAIPHSRRVGAADLPK